MQSNPPPLVYLLDKEPGLSSFQALGHLKKRIGTKKVGHTGTLDPFATGLLIAMTGRMTKAAQLVVNLPKEYETVIRFGEETDTLDHTGESIAKGIIPQYAAIAPAAEGFIGELLQIPPSFSAVKIGGTRAYQQARRGEDVFLPARRIHVYDLKVITWNPPDLSIRVRCSKGTYIRAIARDLGYACGSRAHCFSLRRIAIGPFSVDMVSAEGLTVLEFCAKMNIRTAAVNHDVAKAMRNGCTVSSLRGFSPPDVTDLMVYDERGTEIALLTKSQKHWTYRIGF